jgi:hypothetical protein
VASENKNSEEWVDRQYYPDGKPWKEIHYRGEKPHGWWREWHPNGVLAKEYLFENGLYVNTVIKSWNDKGKLQSESTYVNGETNGRTSVWGPRGRLYFRCYMLDGRAVSRARYDKACESRPELPRYTDADPPAAMGGQTTLTRTIPKVMPTPLPDEFDQSGAEGLIASMLRMRKAEAWTWLKENEDRFLGEMMPEQSTDYVARAYNAGAVWVIAVNISDDGMTANELVLEVPEDKKSRGKVFRFERAQAMREGFEGEKDVGQRFVFLKLC